MQTYVHGNGTQVSSLLHHVHVVGIPYGTPIYYKCARAKPLLSSTTGLCMRCPGHVGHDSWHFPATRIQPVQKFLCDTAGAATLPTR